MARLRLATWNVAWFARLFDRHDRLLADAEDSAIAGVSRARQAEAIAAVLSALDADLVAVIEAPNSGRSQSCVTALERFAAAFGLRQRAAVTGFESPTHQEIALLFDPDRLAVEHAPIGAPLGEAAARAGSSPLAAPRFDSAFAVGGSVCRFSKPPLEAAVRDRATGLAFRLIAVHLKAQGRGGRGDAEARARRIAANRSLQRAQAVWIRARLQEHLAGGEALAVLGDFNDGPAGPDEGPSSVEIVARGPEGIGPCLATPFLQPSPAEAGPRPSSARFVAGPEAGGVIEALVDFILLGGGLERRRPAWRIWHPEADRGCRAAPALAAALNAASDHFPVSVDLDPDTLARAERPAGPERGPG